MKSSSLDKLKKKANTLFSDLQIKPKNKEDLFKDLTLDNIHATSTDELIKQIYFIIKVTLQDTTPSLQIELKQLITKLGYHAKNPTEQTNHNRLVERIHRVLYQLLANYPSELEECLEYIYELHQRSTCEYHFKINTLKEESFTNRTKFLQFVHLLLQVLECKRDINSHTLFQDLQEQSIENLSSYELSKKVLFTLQTLVGNSFIAEQLQVRQLLYKLTQYAKYPDPQVEDINFIPTITQHLSKLLTEYPEQLEESLVYIYELRVRSLTTDIEIKNSLKEAKNNFENIIKDDFRSIAEQVLSPITIVLEFISDLSLKDFLTYKLLDFIQGKITYSNIKHEKLFWQKMALAFDKAKQLNTQFLAEGLEQHSQKQGKTLFIGLEEEETENLSSKALTEKILSILKVSIGNRHINSQIRLMQLLDYINNIRTCTKYSHNDLASAIQYYLETLLSHKPSELKEVLEYMHSLKSYHLSHQKTDLSSKQKAEACFNLPLATSSPSQQYNPYIALEKTLYSILQILEKVRDNPTKSFLRNIITDFADGHISYQDLQKHKEFWLYLKQEFLDYPIEYEVIKNKIQQLM